MKSHLKKTFVETYASIDADLQAVHDKLRVDIKSLFKAIDLADRKREALRSLVERTQTQHSHDDPDATTPYDELRDHLENSGTSADETKGAIANMFVELRRYQRSVRKDGDDQIEIVDDIAD